MTTKKTTKKILPFKKRLSLISQQVTELPVSGHSKSGNYWYDKAAEVFPIFNALFVKHEILPPRMIKQERRITEFGTYPCYEVLCIYVIEDIHSNDSITVMAAGSGFNAEWSLDACHTWCLKRALKDTFLAGCPQPEGEKTSDETFDLPSSISIMQQQALAAKNEGVQLHTPIKDLTDQEIQEQAQETFDPPAPKIEDEEPIKGMTNPGKNQKARIAQILDQIAAICQLSKVEYFESRAKNLIWKHLGGAWPANEKDVEKCIDEIKY